MFPNNSRFKRGRQGFTLTELLVSLTISVAVLGAVFVAFSASNRAIRQGYMTIRGFDLARGTFDILEADLTTAFTQRELGDNHKFFGTPIGFTYIGTSNPATGAGASDVPQIARVTYVVYYGDPSNPTSGRQGSDTVLIQEAFDGYQEGDTVEGGFFQGQEVITYSLLRFVEPGIGDLDSWPAVGGTNIWRLLAAGGEFTNPLIADYLAEPIAGRPELDHAYGVRDNRDLLAAPDLRRHVPPPTPEQQLLQDARKRELWIRMLAGDPRLPNLWQILDLNPRDFVVAENIFLPAQIRPLVPEFTDERFAFFRYGVSQRAPMRVGAGGNIAAGGIPVLDGARIGTTGEFHVREGQPNERWHLYWSSAYNLLYDETAADDPRNFGRISINLPDRREPSSRWLGPENVFGAVERFAPDEWQELIALGATLDRLATDPAIIDFVGIPIANPYNAGSVPGTPYDSQLPEQIHMRFEYLLESPWAGVSEFRREFDQIVDVPAGYTRKPPPTVAGI